MWGTLLIPQKSDQLYDVEMKSGILSLGQECVSRAVIL